MAIQADSVVKKAKGGICKMKEFIRFLREEDGIVAIEYGLIAAAIAVAIATTVWAIGGKVSGIFDDINTALDG